MAWVLFAVVLLVGVVGLGRGRRRQLIEAAQSTGSGTRPRDDVIDELLGTEPTLTAPRIDWAAHRPKRPGTH